MSAGFASGESEMVKRSYKITPEQDAKIVQMSRDMGIDKEEVVQLALENGLAATEQLWIAAGKPVGLIEYAKGLLELKDKRINAPSAKRRER